MCLGLPRIHEIKVIFCPKFTNTDSRKRVLSCGYSDIAENDNFRHHSLLWERALFGSLVFGHFFLLQNPPESVAVVVGPW